MAKLFSFPLLQFHFSFITKYMHVCTLFTENQTCVPFSLVFFVIPRGQRMVSKYIIATCCLLDVRKEFVFSRD